MLATRFFDESSLLDILQQISIVAVIHENVHLVIKLDDIVHSNNVQMPYLWNNLKLPGQEFIDKITWRFPFVDDLFQFKVGKMNESTWLAVSIAVFCKKKTIENIVHIYIKY